MTSTDIETSAVSVDAVALRVGTGSGAGGGSETRSGRGSEVLVHRRAAEPFAGAWALPGVLLGAGERISDAAVRAVGKAGVRADQVTGVGQLVVFDEPHRDPRGPTLSISAWVTLADVEPVDPDAARWISWDAVPPLAFDHERILADVRPVLADRLWRDLEFTAALIGPEFSVRTALDLTRSLTGAAVDRGNLNRTLRRIAVRSAEQDSGGVGRPGALWRWE